MASDFFGYAWSRQYLFGSRQAGHCLDEAAKHMLT
jgi:hypothetical protein